MIICKILIAGSPTHSSTGISSRDDVPSMCYNKEVEGESDDPKVREADARAATNMDAIKWMQTRDDLQKWCLANIKSGEVVNCLVDPGAANARIQNGLVDDLHSSLPPL